MSYQRMTRDEWNDLVSKLGIEEATNLARTFGTVIEGQELPAVTESPASANMGGALPGSNMMDTGTGMTGGLPAAQAPAAPDTLQSLSLLLQQLPEKRAALRQQQLQESRDYINQMYKGPSVSDRLWALSQAFLAPRPYGGFAGTMYNLTHSFGDMAEKRRTAEQQRADALFKLQQQYRAGSLEDEGTALELRYKIAKDQADAAAEAAKARQPKVVALPGGGWGIQPGTGETPPMPEMDDRGNYVITDIRQIRYLPPNSPMVRAGDPTHTVKYSQ